MDYADPTDKEIAQQTLELARSFYRTAGYTSREGYRFDKSRHDHEQIFWRMACHAQEVIAGINVTEINIDEALS